MTNLLVISDIFNGYTVQFLDSLSTIALFVGITVIIIKNPIGSLISLIMLFASISVYLILIGLTFIGFSYLIVYIGAVSILFLFILMLINIRTSELQSNNSNSIPLALSTGILLNYTLFPLLPYAMAIVNNFNNKLNNILELLPLFRLDINLQAYLLQKNAVTTSSIMLVTSNSWDNNITETSHMAAIGNILYTSYNIWLLIAGIILLLSMIGAIIITIKQKSSDNL